MNETNYKDFIKKYAEPFDHQKSVVDSTVAECVKEVKSEYRSEQKTGYRDSRGCRETGNISILCAVYGLIGPCSTDKRSDSESCKKFFVKT